MDSSIESKDIKKPLNKGSSSEKQKKENTESEGEEQYTDPD
jgi:hypothetical protein